LPPEFKGQPQIKITAKDAISEEKKEV